MSLKLDKLKTITLIIFLFVFILFFWWFEFRPYMAVKHCNFTAHESVNGDELIMTKLYNERYSRCLRGRGIEYSKTTTTAK